MEREPWAAIGGLVLVATVMTVVMHPGGLGFARHMLDALRDPRCPQCGYRYSQPVALLTGRDCGT